MGFNIISFLKGYILNHFEKLMVRCFRYVYVSGIYLNYYLNYYFSFLTFPKLYFPELKQ